MCINLIFGSKEFKFVREIKCTLDRGAWLAQLVKHGTLDITVGSSGPTLGVEVTYK